MPAVNNVREVLLDLLQCERVTLFLVDSFGKELRSVSAFGIFGTLHVRIHVLVSICACRLATVLAAVLWMQWYIFKLSARAERRTAPFCRLASHFFLGSRFNIDLKTAGP